MSTRGSLAALARAAAGSLQVDLPTWAPDASAPGSTGVSIGDLPPARHVVVCLIDGLGWQQLIEHRDLAPALADGVGAPIHTVFPSTTAAALGSLGTGLLPGSHGMVGMAFRLPETGSVLHPLHWGEEPLPVMVQPEPTMFEALQAAGVRTTTVAPAAYSASGLTRAVLRGPAYVPAQTVDERVAALAELLRQPSPSFTYVYWPDLDRLGHQHGIDSEQWRDGLGRVDALIAGIRSALTADTLLLVTADHGMVTCPAAERITIDDHPDLLADVTCIAGEPRARHVYLAADRAAAACARWRAVLGERASVLTRAEVVASGLIGTVEPGIDERIGDLVVVPNGSAALASSVDPRASGLLGQHGGWSPAEQLIPLLHFLG